MRRLKIRNMIDYTIFLIIPLSLYLIFFIYPNISSYIYSFLDNQGFLTLDHFRFVGLKNFLVLFLDPNVGILNVILRKIGLDFLAISWLGNVNIVMFTIAGIHIWQGVGTAMI